MILNRQTLKKFVGLAGEKLRGDWVLVGGTVLPYLGVEHRATTDIDFVGLGPKERAQQLEVMKIAEDLGLPVETINSAADYFVQKYLKGKSDLVLLHEGPSASIYRPATILYFRLKLARFSETDAEDCKVWLQHFKVSRAEGAIVAKLLKAAIKKSDDSARTDRLNDIYRAIK